MLASPVARGAPASAAAAPVLAGLQAWLDGTVSLRADFRQSLVSGALGTATVETGSLYLERPGKLRWDYREPDKKIALLLGDRTFLYLEDDRQFVRGRLAADQALFPRLLAGADRVVALFDATLVATPREGGNGSYRLRLTPKERPGGVAVVTLVLADKTFAITGAEVLDEAGNRMTYSLGHLVRNGPQPEGVFAFEPPPGTEIVDTP